jgi:hypothetical protein
MVGLAHPQVVTAQGVCLNSWCLIHGQIELVSGSDDRDRSLTATIRSGTNDNIPANSTRRKIDSTQTDLKCSFCRTHQTQGCKG